MKKKYLPVLFVSALLLLSFGFSGNNTDNMMLNNVVVQFEGTNGNGNNLWLDNFSIGIRYDNDLAISGMNIKDRNYLLPGVTQINISPVLTIFNLGRNAANATVTLTDMGSYNVTKNISSLGGGQTTDITFDAMNFNLNTSKNLKAYITWASDQNKNNDTLIQSSVYYPGVHKKILFEAHTSTTCGPCASQNPYLDAFIQSHFDSLIAIKYHVWWPSLGDPMYAANIPQQRFRTQYNSISAVPTLTIDGVLQQVSGYSTLSNLLNPFNTRRAIASPINITVTDTRLPGDTIKATVNLQVVSPLPINTNYRLKVASLERKITYTTPPGSNGETIFYDVFRRMYPSTAGTEINYTPGNYIFEFKYKRESTWVDSMMYTAVFVQDDYNHEVINSAKARNYYDKNANTNTATTDININQTPPVFSSLVSGGIEVETMEKPVPPPGWSIINADSGYTFWQYIYQAVGGPSFAGAKAIRINYYSYPENIGTLDILRSKVYNNVNLNDTIKFDWAYANRPGYDDRLVVKVSTDGGSTFPFKIFDRQGSVLATAGSSSSGFVPTSTSQWGTFAVSISNLTDIQNTLSGIPEDYALYQNYPNPFNPSTKISFAIPKEEFVNLKVYDITGRLVKILADKKLTAGNYSYEFDGSGIASGVYFYKLEAGNYSDVKKMILIK